METIDVTVKYCNADAAKILGCTENNIRQVKARNSDGLIEGKDWEKEGNSVLWTIEGLTKMAEWVKSEQAIAIRNGNIEKAGAAEIKHHETEIKAESIGNPFEQLNSIPDVLSDRMAQKLIDEGIIKRTNDLTVEKIIRAMARTPHDIKASVDDAFKLLDLIS